MIKFKDLTTSDKETIQSFTLMSTRQNCDLSFSNLISWRFLYNTQFAIFDNHLIFRFYQGRHLVYMMPIAHPQHQKNRDIDTEKEFDCEPHIIKAIRDDSIAMGHPFLLMGICEEHVNCIEHSYPDQFNIKPNRDFSDYLYLRESLETLAGKKLQSKRNHINKFKRLYPQYQYKSLTKDMIEQCILLEEQWQNAKPDSERNESRMSELRSMTRAFHRWDKLGLTGGTIWVDHKLIAFSFGNPINQDTFDVCVEKADTTYEGAFTIINQEFVKHLPEQYRFINREEDMGDEGLRFAKLSYKPDKLLVKYVLTEKKPLAQFENTDRIKKETRKLWKRVFHDPEPFIDLYFKRVYKPEFNVACQIDGKVVGALQTLPYTMLYHQEEVRTVYMSGVSVLPEYQEQNVGNNLMQQAHFELYQKGIVFATLIPAETWLYKWYNKLGYAQAITCTPPPADIRNMDFKQFDEWQRKKSCTILHDEDGLDIIQEDIRLAGDLYQPATHDIPAMVRVINVHKALELFTRANPSNNRVIRIIDDKHIYNNNAYYTLHEGKVIQSDEPNPMATKMTIAQLNIFLFENEHADMTLMLN
ncbi:MAG: GNAT family N-acetyltransferase [Prevotella sp.]